MPKKMLIDATHPEETRVVVVDGNRLEDFDFESASRKQLIGNIYLAKITRIEPSLQAAFVDYGGNRHGFLAFNEIHPDYYQIPVADRQALLAADAAEEKRVREADEMAGDEDAESAVKDEKEVDSDEEPADGISESAEEALSGESETAATEAQEPESEKDGGETPDRSDAIPLAAASPDVIRSGLLVDESGEPAHTTPDGPSVAEETPLSENASSDLSGLEGEEAQEIVQEAQPEEISPQTGAGDGRAEDSASAKRKPRRYGRYRRGSRAAEAATEAGEDPVQDDDSGPQPESLGGGDLLDEMSRPRQHRRRHYKIQEVIKKRQIMLVQILKDERGSKGAALTTHLSIPGRYCVLMPNTARGGGISRKITNAVDRKRLKAVAAELEVPEGMGLIIRTAGANRTKAEIKRDFEYLLRQWENIRELTLVSTAPCLINEEGSIVKRAVRDLYDKEIEGILVEGEASYREAKDFMRLLMPSHAKKVQPYRETPPLFQRYKVEAQLDALFDPTVRLKSGGYIVINPTEALVSIDVNSGKATREANIEATALKTNLEAAEEVARQLRMRDLAGLVVIDFIDMENARNNKAVERRLKECLASDRANIQLGRISPFGLMEMSRQRLRQGVVETTTRPCSHCHGTGLVRSVDSLALRVLRAIEEECQRPRRNVLDVYVPSDVAIYILNQKRQWLQQIEARSSCSIFIIASAEIQPPNFEIRASDRLALIPPSVSAPAVTAMDEEAEEDEQTVTEEPEAPSVRSARREPSSRRRARGEAGAKPQISSAAETPADPGPDAAQADREQDEHRRRRRRSRRRRSRGAEQAEAVAGGSAEEADISIVSGENTQAIVSDGAEREAEIQAEEAETVLTAREEQSAPADPSVAETSAEQESAPVVEAPEAEAVEDLPDHPVLEEAAVPQTAATPKLPEAPAGPKRVGWWQRHLGKG